MTTKTMTTKTMTTKTKNINPRASAYWTATLVPNKEEVITILKAEIAEHEEALKALKAQHTMIVGKVSSYKAPMNLGVGQFIKECILSGMLNKDILKLVQEKYANKNTTYACVAWYRNDLRKKGLV